MNAMYHGRDTVVVVMDAVSARRLSALLIDVETPYQDLRDLKTLFAVRLDGAARAGAEWDEARIARKYSETEA